MLPACVALLAVLSAAEPGSPEDPLVARSVGPALEEDLLQALPPPPETVVRVTKRYGTVTLDHARHLQVRARCSACHGPGPISKITFTPRVAHQACIGCHKQRAEGPTHCAGCHANTTPARTQFAVAEATGARPDDGAAVVAPAAVAPPPPAPPPRPPRTSWEAIEVGCSAGPGLGPALQVTSREASGVVRAYSLERLGADHEARVLGFVGVGVRRPVHPRVALVALGLGGFDAEERPYVGVLPAVGARVGVEWATPRLALVRALHLSLSGMADVPLPHAFGHHSGGGRVYVTLATGIPLPAPSDRRMR